MKRILPVFLFYLYILFGCSNRTTDKKGLSAEQSKFPRVVKLDEAFSHPQKILLSSIADSVSFIRLETNAKCLLGGRPSFHFYPKYIISGSYVFNRKGKFLLKIGRGGRGPGEDPTPYPRFLNVAYADSNFYSMGYKFIKYDSLGRYTGTEWEFLKHKANGPAEAATGYNFASYTSVGNKIALYRYPDSLMWMNQDFRLEDYGAKVIPAKKYNIHCGMLTMVQGYFRNYRNKVLFYNYYNDTIFQVHPKGITPRYVLEFPKYKLPKLFFDYATGPGWMNELFQLWNGGGNFKNSRYFRMSDGKQFISRFLESDQFLFLINRDVRFFPNIRKVPLPQARVTIYDKRNGTVVTSLANGFTDDLLNFKSFLPTEEYDDKLIAPVLPLDIIHYVREKKEKGERVNPKLEKLANSLSENDNPVLMLVKMK